MAVGRIAKSEDVILNAIREAEFGTAGKIHVHVSRKWRETSPARSANRIFNKVRLLEPQPLAVLYFNTRRRVFALLLDDRLQAVAGAKYAENLAFMLEEDLSSTQFENAVRLSVQTLGVTFKKHFPRN